MPHAPPLLGHSSCSLQVTAKPWHSLLAQSLSFVQGSSITRLPAPGPHNRGQKRLLAGRSRAIWQSCPPWQSLSL
jgi:hypothetical protein